jgi:hypothetical protein
MRTPPNVEQRIADFQRHLDWINPRHHWHEARHRFPDGWKPGRYNDHRRMAIDAVMSQEKHGAIGLYYGMNALKENAMVGPTEPNKLLRKAAKGTGASRNQIAWQGTYALDIDSFHPEGVMATDAEQGGTATLAGEVITLIRTYLPEFPEPAWVMTGNGTQLVWPVDGCPDVESEAWNHIVTTLAKRFSDSPLGKIDTTITDAPRILRAPGGINRKGDDTLERPWRYVTATYPANRVAIEHGPHIYRLAVKLGFDSRSVEDRKAEIAQRRAQRRRDGLVDVTPEQILDLIEEYPEHLEYAATVEEPGRTLIKLKTCPFVQRKHTQSFSNFVLYEGSPAGYRCLADTCPCNEPQHGDHSKFELLLDELARLTGRGSYTFLRQRHPLSARERQLIKAWGFEMVEITAPVSIEGPITSELDAAVTPVVAEQATPEPVTLHATEPESQYMRLWQAQHPRTVPPVIKAWVEARREENWAGTEVSTDPTWWGLTLDDVGITWWRLAAHRINAIPDAEDAERARQRALHLWETRDLQKMGADLDVKWLMTIALHKQIRPTLDPSYTPTEQERQRKIALDPTYPGYRSRGVTPAELIAFMVGGAS